VSDTQDTISGNRGVLGGRWEVGGAQDTISGNKSVLGERYTRHNKW
jgi:hypothetical protein